MWKFIRPFYFIYQWLIAGPIFLVLTILTGLVTYIGSKLGNRDFWSYYPGHYWGRLTCIIFLMRVKVVGRENLDPKTSYVFVANHQGAYDIFVLFGYLGHKFIWLMKKGLEKVPVIGKACRAAGHVFVDDSSISGIKETIAGAEQNLKDGSSLTIFPEGSRSWDGNLAPFKRGAFMLAAEFKLPVVPITIDGAFRAMPRFTYNMRPTKIIVTIHKPIFPDERGFNTKKLMQQCLLEISGPLPQYKDGKLIEE